MAALPAPKRGMTCGFSIAHYHELLEAARRGGYRISGFDRPPAAGDLILRHDVDISLDAALAMAELEADEGIRSTWFLMTRSVFYNLASSEGERTIARLRALGHRVAHHAVWPHIDLDERFDPVVAWHNPDPEYMSAPIAGAVNVYAEPHFSRPSYRSDSNQRWRAGCPHEELRAGAFPWLQLLVHPELWVYRGATIAQTMHAMLDAERVRRLEQLAADNVYLD